MYVFLCVCVWVLAWIDIGCIGAKRPTGRFNDLRSLCDRNEYGEQLLSLVPQRVLCILLTSAAHVYFDPPQIQTDFHQNKTIVSILSKQKYENNCFFFALISKFYFEYGFDIGYKWMNQTIAKYVIKCTVTSIFEIKKLLKIIKSWKMYWLSFDMRSFCRSYKRKYWCWCRCWCSQWILNCWQKMIVSSPI